MIIEFNKPTDLPPKGGKPSEKPSASDDSSESPSKDQPGDNRGTLIVDATCAPQNIRFPQDVNILNEGRKSWRTSSAASAMCITCTDPGCTGGRPAGII